MKATMLGTMFAVLAGCAHGVNGDGREQSLRGSAQVNEGARLLVGGPTVSVHTNVEGIEPVTLFVVDLVKGDDGDCAPATSAHTTVIAPEARGKIEIGAGRELCALATVGSMEVLWHAEVKAPAGLWARK
jgi:hypothetical protein